MNRALTANTVLMIIALVVAYSVWTGGEQQKNPKPVLARIDADELVELSYTWPEGETRVQAQGQGEQRSYSVHLQSKPKAKPAPTKARDEDAGVEDAASKPAEPEPLPPAEIFPAGSSVTAAIAKLTPLKVLRRLGRVDAERSSQMGLDQPQRSLAIQTRTRTWTLRIGDKTYGSQAYYARLDDSDEVVLLPASVVRGFEGKASRLMEWRLAPARVNDITAIDLQMGGKRKIFTQVDREQPSKRHFALQSAPEQKSEEATSWVNRLRGLRATQYRPQAPATGSTTVIANITIQQAKAQPVELIVHELKDGGGYLVRKGRFYAEVSTPQISALIEDMAPLMDE